MAEFNPAVPETQEPNYLRYSRPSNWAPENKGPAEAIKAVSETLGQTVKTVDSTVKRGLEADVASKSQALSDDFTKAAEGEYNRLYGTQISGGTGDKSLLTSDDMAQATPDQVKNLPAKVDALKSAWAKGGFVQTQYRSSLDNLAKTYRSQFPGFTQTIDRAIAQASGNPEANAHVSQLLAGINAKYAQIDNEQKRKESMFDGLAKEGHVQPSIFQAVKSGRLSMEDGIQKGLQSVNNKQQLEISGLSLKNQAEQGALNTKQAESDMDLYAHRDLAAHLDALTVASGVTNGQDFLKMNKDYTSGKIPLPSAEAIQKSEQMYEADKKQWLANMTKKFTNTDHSSIISEDARQKKMKEYGELYDNYSGFIHYKDFNNAFSYKTYLDTMQERKNWEFAQTTPGQIGSMAKAVEAGSPKVVGDLVGSQIMGDPRFTTPIQSMLYDHVLQAVGGQPDPNKPAPSVHTTLNQLNSLGVPGSAKKVVTDLPKLILDKGLSEDHARKLIDYTFGGDGPKIWSQLEKESQGKGTTGHTRANFIGRESVWEDYTDPKFADKVQSLGPKAYSTYKDGIENGFKTAVGPQIKDLDNLQGRFKVSYSSDTHQLVMERKDVTHPIGGRAYAGQPETTVEANEIKSINRMLKGYATVVGKEQGVDVNASILKVLKDQGLTDGPVTKQIMDAIINSHKPQKQSMNEDQGEVLSDASPDAIRPGQQYAMAAGNPLMPRLFQQGGEGGGGFPTSAPKPVKGATPQGAYDTTKLGREIPAEVPSKEQQRENFMSLQEQAAERGSKWNQPTVGKVQKGVGQDLEKHLNYSQAEENKFRHVQDNLSAFEMNAKGVIQNFKGHPREEEILNSKLDSLKLRAKNFGPKGEIGTQARNDAKLIRARLKQINVDKVGDQMEKGIKDTVDKEFNQ